MSHTAIQFTNPVELVHHQPEPGDPWMPCWEVIVRGNTLESFDSERAAKLEYAFQLCQVIRCRHYRQRAAKLAQAIADHFVRVARRPDPIGDDVITGKALMACLDDAAAKAQRLGWYW